LDFFGRAEFEVAADAVRQRIARQPRVGLVLGSGLGDLAESVQEADVIPYQDIPHWPRSTVVGHRGQLHIGTLEGVPVMVMRGRAHYYEGYSMTQVTLPIRVMQLLGVEVLILTNAAGGLNKSFTPGDLMLLVDHLNLLGMTGANPLRGPNDETLGTRFPDMTRVYDRDLRSLAAKVAVEQGVPLHQGVYICLAGPSFETPADVRFLRTMGADAVGMSTVPEATVARHGGLRVMGVSSIANIVIDDPDSDAETTHEEVLAAGALAVPRLEALVRGVLRGLA
jgi:purine-nucleoside phosphorylase